MKRSRLRIMLLAVLAAGVTACADRDPASTPGSDSVVDSAATAAADLAASTPAAPDPHDPCRLLTAGEVEAVLGAPLVGAPYLTINPESAGGGVPDDTGYVCWYSTKGNRNLAISANWENAGAISRGINARVAKMENESRGMLKLQDGSELTGDWDEARMRGCCTLSAIQGDRMVEINFGGSLASEADIAPLVNAALARLDKPLPISGRAGNAAAQKREDARYASTEACAYWTVADVQRLLGGDEAPVVNASGRDCHITFSGERGSSQMSITVTPRNGYRTFRDENATYAGAARGINADNEGSVTLREAVAIEGPWEAAEQGPIQFNAVRHDASIALRHGGLSIEHIRAIVGHAFDRIDAGATP